MADFDPLTDSRFADPIFSNDDRRFMAEFFVKYPGIGDSFCRFLEITPFHRPELAREIIKTIPRTGWARRGIEKPETIFEHVEGLADFIGNFLIRSSASPLRRIYLQEMARVHDLPEAIATDFTHHDTISTEDKHRIEMLAAKVIFEAPEYARELAMVDEYVAQVTPESHLLHDFDKLHAVRGALFYESLYPEKAGLWDEFYNHTKPKMKTVEGKNILKILPKTKKKRLEN